jgi:undecaprenyl pyrophosphate phosphatase UppP
LAGLVAVVVGLHFYDCVEDCIWGDGVVVIEMVIMGCLFVNVKPLSFFHPLSPLSFCY